MNMFIHAVTKYDAHKYEINEQTRQWTAFWTQDLKISSNFQALTATDRNMDDTNQTAILN